jgi:hypothetical protein
VQPNHDNTHRQRPLIVFTTCHPWIKRVVAEVQPPGFDVRFLEMSDDKAVETVLPQADFLVCLALNAQQARLLRNCKLVMHNGVCYEGL